MNDNQIVILWGAIILICLILIVPPWKFTLDIPYKAHIEKPGPYSLVFKPPSIPVTGQDYGGNNTFWNYSMRYWTVRLDIERMILPIVFVALVSGGVLIALQHRKKKGEE